MKKSSDFQEKAINTIRFLSADGVQKAKSGHPGLPMGTAAIAYALWTRHLKINPGNPQWFDRDRFILSGGHGSMLLYSLLYLSGFDLPLEELQNFRQWGSLTPGHPEYGLTPGVETTTGPLGQGFANGVGMAIAEAHLAELFNQPGFNLIDHYTYAIVTDGDLMEGVCAEAASLAGHLKLGKLIYLYDDNHITIEGSTELAFTEDTQKRFEAYGWQVLKVEDGNDVEAIDQAIIKAKLDPRPSLIACRTQIGYGLPTKQGSEKAHGEAPGEEELLGAKKNLGWPTTEKFFVPEEILTHFRTIKEKGSEKEQAWNELLNDYQKAFPDLSTEFQRRSTNELPDGWETKLKEFEPDPKGMATRQSSGVVLNQTAEILPELMGGSADLSPSNKSWIDNSTAFNSSNKRGRNFHFGVREHAMGSIVNGMAYHGGFIPYGATFLVFSDYMRPAVRLSALSHLQTIWVYTHDSIGLGEDGPTHQPVEHLASLRAIPHLYVIRPADANEVREAWICAINRRNGPTALALSRQNLPTLDRKEYASAAGLHKGAYVLKQNSQDDPDFILMASGSEVSLIIDVGEKLVAEGKKVRIISFPCWELFEKQPQAYQDSVLGSKTAKRIAVEAGIKLGWEKWVGSDGLIIGMDSFGASAPAEILFQKYGFSSSNILNQII